MTAYNLEQILEKPREGYLSKINFGKPEKKVFKLAYFETFKKSLEKAVNEINKLFSDENNHIQILPEENANYYQVILKNKGNQAVINNTFIPAFCIKEISDANNEEIHLAFLYHDGNIPSDTVTTFEPLQTLNVKCLFRLSIG